jgi:hypothetical protein
VLHACDCESVGGGGWAVWRHGYVGRVTQDVDIAIPQNRLDEFLKAASVSGFEVLKQQPGRWPKLTHKETGIEVDVLPEGGRPGTPSRPAPTTIPHPKLMGAARESLRYMSLVRLVELKLAAAPLRDEADVLELTRENPDQVDDIREHLKSDHPQYAARFEELLTQLDDTAGG